mmetsp:Transcript_14922/g.41112  ORF Transcript_14922/g.41112 Transcript_14922/m.41112 type:complete len:249 (-) Transcript_14922:416-1162(-)
MPITIRQRVPCQRDAAEPSLFHNGFHAVLIELHTLLISTNEVSPDHGGDRRLEFDAHLHVSDGICEDLHVRRAIDGDSYHPMLSTKNRVVADRHATRPRQVQDGLVIRRGRHLTAVYKHITTTDIHSGTPGVAGVVIPDDEPADHRALGTFTNTNATKNHRLLDRHWVSDENHPTIQYYLLCVRLRPGTYHHMGTVTQILFVNVGNCSPDRGKVVWHYAHRGVQLQRHRRISQRAARLLELVPPHLAS